MSLKRIVLLAGTLLLSCIGLMSCNTGLGEEVDVIAPTINITSHKQNDYAPLKFTLSGTYSDNLGLTEILVSYKYKENSTDLTATLEKELKAFFNDSKTGIWTCDLEFPCNQEVDIEVFAIDKMKNESTDSKDAVTLVIDSGLPEIGTITLTKDSGYTSTAIPINRYLGEDGKTEKRNDSSNKDYFHNENVTISTNVIEDYEVKEAVLNIYEITEYNSDTGIYEKKLIHGEIPADSNKNLFNPRFTLTQSMLTEWDSALATGLHYILPEIVITDGAGSKSIYDFSNVPNVFAWEAEYDIPQVTVSANRSNGKIRIPQETPINVQMFDDDGLKYYQWILKKNNDTEGVYTRWDKVDLSKENVRDDNFEITTGIKKGIFESILPDGNYTLTIEISDFNPLNDQRTNVVKKITEDVKITNADSANVNVITPEYNEKPVLDSNSNFVLSGEVIDNAVVDYIAVAWCRPGADQSIAEKYFETFNFANTPVSDTNAIISEDQKLKIWNIGKTDSSVTTTGTYISNFSKTFNIYNDFKDSYGKDINETKIFVIGVLDATGNLTTEVHRVGAFKSIPKFELSMSDSENGTYTNLTQTTISAEPGKNIYLKIKPTCELPITKFEVGKEGNKQAFNNEIETGHIYNISETDSDTKFKLEYSAEDIFGNANNGSFTVQFEKIPELTDIVLREEGATLKNGDTLNFQVSFDKSISVIGSPTIIFDCYKKSTDETPSGTITANYVTGSDTTTLHFNYNLNAPVEYEKLSLKKENNNWITLNGAEIKRSTMYAKLDTSIENSSFTVLIDSKNPTVNSELAGARAGVNFSRKSDTDTSIDIKFNFSEPVTNKNGYITIYRKGSEDVNGTHTWHIPAVISADVFEKIWNNSSSANRIVLSSSDTEKSVNATGTLVSKGPYKMYTNSLKKNDYVIYQYTVSGGNAVKSDTVIAGLNTVMVPDLTTKYVLDYQYDTTATSGDVANIRAALEAVNYHKTTVALSRLTFNSDNTSATLNLKDSDFIDGIRDGVEYIITIPAGSFVDNVQNATASASTFTFTVGKVAKPVIRVNRWSTNSNTVLDSVNPDGQKLKAGVKIDCETPGAQINYQVTNLYVESDYGTTTSNYQRNIYAPDIMPGAVGSASATLADKAATFNNGSSLTGGTPAFDQRGYKQSVETTQTYNNAFYVGTGNVDTGERIYIGANATCSTIANLQKCDDVYEGAFKTVLHYNSMLAYGNNPGYSGERFKVFACQTPEGVSYVAGWPLSMRQHFHSSTTEVGTEDCYKLAYKAGTNDYKWVSWELLSEDFFTTTTVSWNFQVTIDTLVTYGSYVWGYKVSTWGMTLE